MELRGPWAGRTLPMELLLSVAGGGLGMSQIGSYRDRGIEYENESGVASRILRNRSTLGR